MTHHPALAPVSRLVACAALTVTLGLAAVAEGQAAPAHPVAPDSSHLALLEWRSIGPSRGGRSLAVAGDPVDRATFYFGATGGGVWKTENAGASWRNVSDGYFATGSVGAIAVASSDRRVIYVGTGEACIRGDVSHGDGVYKSMDGGATWRNIGLGPTRHIARIRVHPTNPNLVYVAALGDAFGPSADRGVYRSRDGGARWEKVLYRGEDAGAIDLVIDPLHPNVLYASFLDARRKPWGLRSAGPGTGLFRSTDGGDSWTDLTTKPGMPTGPKGRIGIALSPAKSGRVWAIVDAATGSKGLFRSDNAGETWKRVSDNAELTQRPWYYHHIFADPRDSNTVWVLNIDAWKSTDGGVTFTEVRAPHGDHHDLWLDPADPRRLIEANDGGASVSFDGGRSWSSEANQPTGQFYHVAVDHQFPYKVYGAQQDYGGISLPSNSDFGAIGASEWETIGGGESGYVAVDPTDPNTIYSGEHHWLERYDRRTHQTRDISPWPETHYGWGSRDIRYRFQWTYPVVLSPHDRGTLYAGANVLFRTTTGGDSWDVVSPELGRRDPRTLEQTPTSARDSVGSDWGPITRDNTGVEWYGTIFTVAESPRQRGVLWAGTDDGVVQLSRDGGAHWTKVTPPDLPEFALVSIIEPSHFSTSSAYVAATRYKLQDRSPYLFKTTDYGRTWTRITAGIPASDFTRVVREDPTRRGLLYAGTETGVHVSFDDGVHWQSLRMNLPVVPVHDLIVKGRDLVAATHGRAFWVLDDVSALRALTAPVIAAPTILLAPDTVVRFRGATPTALREVGEAAGANKPRGVVLRFHLATDPRLPATLAIRDAAGQTIREWSSADTAAGRPISRRDRVGGRGVLVAHAGANRFVWDLRYPAPKLLTDVVVQGRGPGPLVPPGVYEARLSVDGATVTQRFAVVRDQRVRVTDADLVEQFRFVRNVQQKLEQAHDGVRRLRALRAALGTGAPKDTLPAAATARRARGDQIDRLEGLLIQPRARAAQDLTNFPVMLDSKLSQLANFASQADARPTRQSYALFKELAERVDRALTQIVGLETASPPVSAP
ncbi:MAG: hypothetical protein NVS1B4_00980 [Gemmatimonadaceae bacterium]